MSDPIQVLITLPFTEEMIQHLCGLSPDLKIEVVNARKAEEIPAEVWGHIEVLYTHRVLPAPELAPKLRWIQFHWAGIDHALNEPILKKPDLVITNLSGASASQMAEHAVMMMLALGHNLPDVVNLQKRAEWPSNRWERLLPFELRGSKVGIVGYGSIGRQIARLLNTFGATVLATKRDAMHPEDTGYIVEGQGDPAGDFVHRLYPTQALRSMLKECDFVVITVPLTAETRNMISTVELEALKTGACLVDISRGGVVDHSALIPLLRDRKIAGAALDVFPTEPLPADSPLWKMPNVILTPHIAGFSPHYDQRAIALFAENLSRYLAGLPLHNRFILEKEY